MDIEVIYATEFGSSSTTMKIYKLASWIKRYNFKILSIEEQQQSYSEEEVLEIIKKLHTEIGFQFTNEIKEWVNKQFKNE